jgi:hypothetical protein
MPFSNAAHLYLPLYYQAARSWLPTLSSPFSNVPHLYFTLYYQAARAAFTALSPPRNNDPVGRAAPPAKETFRQRATAGAARLATAVTR